MTLITKASYRQESWICLGRLLLCICLSVGKEDNNLLSMLIVTFSRLKYFIITNDKEAAGNQEQDKEISD